MTEKSSRVSLTLPEELLKELDQIVKNQNYSSRSKAVRDALRDFLTEYKWREELKGEQFGVVVLVYAHGVPDLTGELLDIQHGFGEVVNSVQHLHVTESDCLETLIVKGEGEQIRELVNKLTSLRGVKQVKLTTIGK
ncbi:nickel-responsive regulator [candidate division MSBL1 archaeon SCGC-AAA261G05]|uniref:Putative nickel-responsive regulator n=2 Tax=candidate division MSBL1 TaxID=215777 RepID=A0A133V1I7_9EURY|nr:nickel-responsive regulator [candidate division MSBL1 archaeon SCGC-AAA261C02]KXB04071.1 nickel-responsive regulator [candidate division MSBL1 archaeon SCGC-AAA261G05]